MKAYQNFKSELCIFADSSDNLKSTVIELLFEICEHLHERCLAVPKEFQHNGKFSGIDEYHIFNPILSDLNDSDMIGAANLLTRYLIFVNRIQNTTKTNCINFIETDSGLLIKVTDKGKFVDTFEDYINTETGEVSYCTIWDFLEDLRLLGNNWDDLTDCIPLCFGEAIGCDYYIYSEDDTHNPDNYEKVWVYEQSAIKNYLEVLYNEGSVFFTNAKED